MTSRIWSKKFTQEMIRKLRGAGYEVEKWTGGYKMEAPDGTLLFKAMNGSTGYLVRYATELFTKG